MNSNTVDIRAIIERAKAGDSDAFATIYEEYYSPIYRYLYSRTNSRVQAEDLTQEVFLRAFGSMRSFKPTKSAPLAYFYRIARNIAIDFSRKKHQNVSNPDQLMEGLADDGPHTEESVIQKEQIRYLNECLSELPDEQREVITLRFIGDRSNKEIAEMMKKNEAAVRQSQSRGLKILNELFKKKYNAK